MERRIIKYFINDIEYCGNIFIKKTNSSNNFGYESYADSDYTIQLEMRKVNVEHDNHYFKIEDNPGGKIEETMKVEISKYKIEDKLEVEPEYKIEDKIEDNKMLYLLCPIIILIKLSFL